MKNDEFRPMPGRPAPVSSAKLRTEEKRSAASGRTHLGAIMMKAGISIPVIRHHGAGR